MTAPEDDLLLGRAVIEQNLVSREALLETLFQAARERREGNARPLGVTLVARGLITQSDLDQLISSRLQPRAKDAGGPDQGKIGRLLVAVGLVTPANIAECVKLQEGIRAAGKTAPPIGEILVSRGYVTQAQIQRVLGYQKKKTYACPRCSIRMTSDPPPAGKHYTCRTCGDPMTPVETKAAPEGPSLREAGRGEETQVEIDRALAAYLKQKDVVRRDRLREAQRLQSEFSRYGLVVPLLEFLRRIEAISSAQQHDLEKIDFGEIIHAADWKNETIPGYRLNKQIASGGFAAIWTAKSLFGGDRVAVKLLHPERAKDPRSVARFEWEAMLLRKFNHPHLVRGLDMGVERGTHFIIMEYVEGRSLGQVLYESGAFPVRDALSATLQVCRAIDYLHGKGYLHRDVKPDNVLIDGAGNIKLCDLGFAAPIPKFEGDAAATATAVGTSGYMSPEVARGQSVAKIDSDLYSLGILTYALLTGDEPFTGASSEEVVTDQLDTGMPIPNLMLVPAEAPVVSFLKRLMHPNRTRRYRSTKETLEALEKLVHA